MNFWFLGGNFFYIDHCNFVQNICCELLNTCFFRWYICVQITKTLYLGMARSEEHSQVYFPSTFTQVLTGATCSLQIKPQTYSFCRPASVDATITQGYLLYTKLRSNISILLWNADNIHFKGMRHF